MATKWMSERECNICNAELDDVLIDGATVMGPWATMCKSCHAAYGRGLGTGRGQRYEMQDGEFIKVEG